MESSTIPSSSSSFPTMESSLIASIQSVVGHFFAGISHFSLLVELAIEVRNMEALLVVLKRNDGVVSYRDFINSSATLPSIFTRMEDADGIMCQLETSTGQGYDDSIFQWIHDLKVEIHCFGEEAYTALRNVPLLTVYDVVAIADSILDNCLDFLMLRSELPVYHLGCHIYGFEVQMQFLRSFLVFAELTGIQLHDLLILVKPVILSATRVLLDGISDTEWKEDVRSKYSMATELQIYDACARALSTSTTGSQYADVSGGHLLNLLDSLISLLWDLLRHSDSRQDQLAVLYARLRSCRAILKQYELINFDRIGELIRDAALIICLLHSTEVEKEACSILDWIQKFDAIEMEIQNVPSQASESPDLVNLNICNGDERDLNVHEDTQMPSHQKTTPQVVFFQRDEVNSMLDQLTRGTKQLHIVPISGMAGIGKTTFALELYNHRSIMYHFQARAWCSISHVPDKKKVLFQLLNQIHESGTYSEMTEDDLADTLRKRLKGKRYLIVLDDVWTLDVWNSLEMSFPDDSTQSRIIFTSRDSEIAPPSLLNGQPYSLRLREDHECLEILHMKLSHEEGWNPDIGMEIAKLCKGLPLVVVIVAGLLASVKQQAWKGILDRLSSNGVSREEQCINSLELSFKHLPDDLKLCYLYFGAFLEGDKVSVKRLIRLWMAEGFVKENDLKTSEDVGREYLQSLIQRSLVMVVDRTSIGGVKSCWIHDIMRDFCLTKARQDNSFHILYGDDQLLDFNEPRCLQRLCIHSSPIHFQNARLFCPRAHSLLLFSPDPFELTLFDLSFIIQIFKLLKVLDLRQFGVVPEIPSEIGVLTRLTYLAVQSRLPGIPYSIGKLSNLENLIIVTPTVTFEVISFPNTLWNLQKLKYLQLYRWFTGYSLSIENLENCSNMLELGTLSGVVFSSDGSMETYLKKFLNIRRLKCRILPDVESTVKLSKIVIPDSLKHLQSVTIYGEGKLGCEFGSTQKLRKLSLAGFELSREEIAVIGKFPNLEVLKLLSVSFSGGTLEMEEGDFLKLKIFHLHDQEITRWTASDEQRLPNLKKLVMSDCYVLEEIPSTCLETSLQLEEIEVRFCSSTSESLVKAIAAVHEDFENFVKVSIRSMEPV